VHPHRFFFARQSAALFCPGFICPSVCHLFVPDLPPPEAFVRAQLFFTSAIFLPLSSDQRLVLFPCSGSDQLPGVQFEISSCDLFLRSLVYGLLQVKSYLLLSRRSKKKLEDSRSKSFSHGSFSNTPTRCSVKCLSGDKLFLSRVFVVDLLCCLVSTPQCLCYGS
jgi:hypothetical protein